MENIMKISSKISLSKMFQLHCHENLSEDRLIHLGKNITFYLVFI